MWAVIVNTLAIVAGCAIGLLVRRGLPERVTDAILKALGLITVVIGVQGTVDEPNILVMIVSCVVGVGVGEALDIDGHVNRWAERLTSRFAGAGEGAKAARAFITSCLVMNVGAMTIVGSLNAGLGVGYEMLYTKSLLDFTSGIIMTAAMGPGVAGSAAFTLVFQGAIVLLAGAIAPFMTDALVTELACTGSLMILATGLNMLEVCDLKILNYVPGLLVVPLAMWLLGAIGMA